MEHKLLTFTCNSALRKCVQHPLCCTRMSYLRESWLRPLVLSGDMLRSRAFVLLTIFNSVNQILTEQIVDTNGWIPMTHNDIYNQIRRNSHNANTLPENSAYFAVKPPMDYDKDLLQRKLKTEKNLRDFKESFKIRKEKHFDTITVADNIDYRDQAIVNSKENTREAKKVWNHELDLSINNTVDLSEIDSTKQNIDETSVANEDNAIENVVKATATSKAYEVIEDSDKSPATEDYYTTETFGYQYNPPTDENQNLTSTFYKILSKYNINLDDRLQNYDLSLQRKVQNPSTSAYRVPLPFGYNNLNHLPVDPLLAVFLSNYGFYLPSLYGIKANYNNLYGYLASNNIHNNKPFGLYKVFSDTDSWN